MIENLIHTVSKENKPSQYGPLQAAHSKSETGLEGQFRALFQSFNSELGISEDSQTDQEQLNETDEAETKMEDSSDTVKVSDAGSAALKNIEKEELNDQNSADQKSENTHENSDLTKITVIDESKGETENSETKVEDDLTEMKEANISESGDPEVEDKRNPESKNERVEIQDLSKIKTETESENQLPENAQSLDEANSENEQSSSENSAKVDFRRESPSEVKERLSNSALKMERISTDKSETENIVDTNVSRSASKVQHLNELESSKESAETVSIGSDKPDQESRVENPITKQESSAGLIEKSEPEVSKSESNEFRRFINVDEGSNTIQKSGEGLGTTLQSERSSNEVMNPVEPNKPVLTSDQHEQFSLKENSLSTDFRSSEVSAQISREGDAARENLRSTEREANRVQPFTILDNGDTQKHGATLNSSETRQNSDTAERLVDRFIHENLEKPIRIAQKPVESTILMQDKFQPKKERNDVLFLNNNELKESSRLSIPGIGADSAKQNTSFSSGQFSEDFSGLSESEKNEILWKEHTAESAESDELNRSELSAAALAKLGDSTLSNHFLRRVLLPGLTQTVLTASSQSDRTENWQRHNFILEDGSKVQLSARKVDGVLQIKLGASLGELSKLLQIHQNEIREHLEKECNIKIDLHFEQGSGDQDQSSLENFFGESTKKPVFKGGNGAGSQANRNVKNQLHTVVSRNFGYNSKEWTA